MSDKRLCRFCGELEQIKAEGWLEGGMYCPHGLMKSDESAKTCDKFWFFLGEKKKKKKKRKGEKTLVGS